LLTGVARPSFTPYVNGARAGRGAPRRLRVTFLIHDLMSLVTSRITSRRRAHGSPERLFGDSLRNGPAGCVIERPLLGRASVARDLPLDVLGEVRKGGSKSLLVVLWANAVWDVIGSDVDATPSIDSGDLPGHGHRPGEGRVVGNEVHRLHDANAGNELDVSRLDDVRSRRGLSRAWRTLGVTQDQPVGASRPRIESLELGRHSIRRKPRGEGFLIDEGFIDLRWRGGDDPRCEVRARHPQERYRPAVRRRFSWS
jgi:hypothetical protein